MRAREGYYGTLRTRWYKIAKIRSWLFDRACEEKRRNKRIVNGEHARLRIITPPLRVDRGLREASLTSKNRCGDAELGGHDRAGTLGMYDTRREAA